MLRVSLAAMDMPPPSELQIGRRRDSRLRLNIPARLETIYGNVKVVLIDLSQSGGHLLTGEKQLCGKDAVLGWLQYEAFGRIVWSTDRQAGLEFDGMLTPQTLLATRDAAERDPRKEEQREAFLAARAWYNGHR